MNSSRRIKKYSIDNITLEKLLSSSKQFDPFILLNSNTKEQYQKDKYSSYDLLIAAGSINEIQPGKNIFEELKYFQQKHNDWIFGYFSYDLKNQIEKLSSDNFDGIKAPDYHFFQPRYVLCFKNDILIVHYHPEYDNEDSVDKLISEINDAYVLQKSQVKTNISSRVSKNEYTHSVNQIKSHIQRGDIYEMNYCMEFYSEDSSIDPPSIYYSLNKLSPMPFSTYLRLKNHYLMCASPERFIAKRKNKIISQPIKGTAKRKGEIDTETISSLRNDPKEQAENIMIVDLVRNDLSRTAKKKSVIVEKLFGVNSFRHLHQLVSTVTSELNDEIHFTEAIKYAFPMGSMTGAPKISAMEIIEKYESTKRGIFSGASGYISPESDFDFNVIIRSILYNSENCYLSFMAGSAITIASDPEKEYEECMLKMEAMKKVLQ
jgi:para-aminobenzoate synthetase component 1